jgi:hypothetical protein
MLGKIRQTGEGISCPPNQTLKTDLLQNASLSMVKPHHPHALGLCVLGPNPLNIKSNMLVQSLAASG